MPRYARYEKKEVPYVVEKLTSYGRETPILSALMTGSILLKGSDYNLLKKSKMLYKI